VGLMVTVGRSARGEESLVTLGEDSMAGEDPTNSTGQDPANSTITIEPVVNLTNCQGKPYFVKGLCVDSCPGGTAPAAAYNNTCSACKDLTPYVYNNSCVSVCPAQHVSTGGDTKEKYNCRPCETNLPFVDRATDTCVDKCPDDLPYSDNSECVVECPAGSAPQGCLDDASSCPDDRNASRCRKCSNPNPEDGFDPVPYADHAQHKCVAQCPSGHAPNSEYDCVKCEGDTRFTTPRRCVAQCPPGQGANAENDCYICSGNASFADHWAHSCVESCPNGTAPDDKSDCTPCAGDTPFAEHLTHTCVLDCPQDFVTNEKTNDCDDPCGRKPYRLGNSKCTEGGDATRAECCVSECPPGEAPSEEGACEACVEPDPYADHTNHTCVARCPFHQAPNNASDCVLCDEQQPYVLMLSNHTCVAECPVGTSPDSNGDCALSFELFDGDADANQTSVNETELELQ